MYLKPGLTHLNGSETEIQTRIEPQFYFQLQAGVSALGVYSHQLWGSQEAESHLPQPSTPQHWVRISRHGAAATFVQTSLAGHNVQPG